MKGKKLLSLLMALSLTLNSNVTVYAASDVTDYKIINNHHNYLPKYDKPYGSLTISKTVEGSGTPSADTSFDFTVTKGGMAAIGQYSIDGGTKQPIPVDGKISLKDGETALLTDLEPGEYVVTESIPNQKNYKSTSFSVNNGAKQSGYQATVNVEGVVTSSDGGWVKENGDLVKDADGYYTYVLTSDQIDSNKLITVDCDPLAEIMIAQMQAYQNFYPRNFKVKFVNETGGPLQYQDYNFDTVNWMPIGQTYSPATNPTMKNTNEGASSYSAGYGWGDAWVPMYSMLIGQDATAGSLKVNGFDGNPVRTAIAPLRCINPAIISFFNANPYQGTLTGNSSTNNAQTITLLQMNAFPELIKQAFTFKDWTGTQISLPADDSRSYTDFICAFYGVNSLDELTVAQKYNVLGTGFAGSPAMPYGGQSNITTYYANRMGVMSDWCIPYAQLNDGTLDYFKTWGFSETRIEAGKKLISGGQIFADTDADTYAYQQNYYLLESDYDMISMAYDYLYSRCIRFSLDTNDRIVPESSDNNSSPNDSVSGIKEYMDKTNNANNNVLTAMNNGAEFADGESIALDRIRGYIEVPNAWNQFRYYDFGFQLIFKSNATNPTPESVSFTNTYELTPLPEPKVGNLTVTKTVEGNAGSKTDDFNFTVTLSDTSINGVYGDMKFTNGVASFSLKDGESKTANKLPEGINYTVVEEDYSADGYITSKNGDKGTIVNNQTATASYINTKNITPPDPVPPKPIPPKPIPPIPQTGDNSNLNYWTLVLVGGIVAVTVIFLNKKTN